MLSLDNILSNLTPLNLNNVKVRILPVERWQEFKELRLEALKTEPEVFGQSFDEKVNEPDDYWQKRLEQAANPTDYALMFADYKDKLIGMIGAVVEENTAKIGHYYIKKEFRHRGVGRKLIEQLLILLKPNPLITRFELDINAHEKNTILVFKQFGFHVTQEFAYRMGDGQDHDALVMVKQNT